MSFITMHPLLTKTYTLIKPWAQSLYFGGVRFFKKLQQTAQTQLQIHNTKSINSDSKKWFSIYFGCTLYHGYSKKIIQTLLVELVTRMTLQVDMYFSIVLLRACWVSLVNLSTSVKTTTLNSFWPSLLSWCDPATVLRRPCTTTLSKSHLTFAQYPRMYRVEESQIENIQVIPTW